MTTSRNYSIKASRLAVLAMFFLCGAIFANWVSRIPQIQATLTMSEGELGIVLLGLAVGVLLALSIAGGLIARFGSRTITTTGAVLLCLLLPSLGLMPHPVALSINLFLFGAAMSLMDVAMNAQGVDVEQKLGQTVMSSFHAAFSIGGFVGAALGAGMALLKVQPALHFLIASAGFLVLILLTAPALLPLRNDVTSARSEPVFQLPARVLWPLGAVVFCAFIGEGAMADWSGVYLMRAVGTDAGTAAFGFAVFSLTMTAGRLAGDRLATQFEPALLVRAGGIIASMGVLLAILLPQVAPSLLGFAAVGAGLSIVVPLAFSAAGNIPGIAAGAGIAGVASIGYAGFLAGPPIIGLVAEMTSLRISMLLVVLLTGSLIFSAQALQRKQTKEPVLATSN